MKQFPSLSCYSILNNGAKSFKFSQIVCYNLMFLWCYLYGGSTYTLDDTEANVKYMIHNDGLINFLTSHISVHSTFNNGGRDLVLVSFCSKTFSNNDGLSIFC